jgi:hypothetical protein
MRLDSIDRFTVAHITAGDKWIPVREGRSNSRPLRFHSMRQAEEEAARRTRLAKMQGIKGAFFKAVSLASMGY